MPNPPMTLPQAAQSNDVTGALQQLLLSRVPTPDQDYWQRQGRQDTLEDYQAALRRSGEGMLSPAEAGFYGMINNFGPAMPTGYAALRGAALGGAAMEKRAAAQQTGDVAAAKAGYEDAKADEKLDLAELGIISRIAGGRGGAGSFIQFKDDAGNLYIMNKGTGQKEMIPATHTKLWGDAYAMAYKRASEEGMANPEDYATNLANATMRKVPGGMTTVDTVQKGTRPVGELGPINPGVTPIPTDAAGAPMVAPDDSKAGAKGFPSGRAPESDRNAILQSEYDREGDVVRQLQGNPADPRYQQALRNQAILRQEAPWLGKTGGVAPVATGQGVAAATTGGSPANTPVLTPTTTQTNSTAPAFNTGVGSDTLAYKNKPAEKGSIAGNEAMNKGYGEDYTTVRSQADSASQMYDVFNQLEKIDPKTDLLNRPKAFIGQVFSAFGVDPNSPSVKSAVQRRESEQLLSMMSNSFLRGEKGVQTKSDEVRIQAELPKLSDTPEAWKMMVEVGKERAKRKMEMLQFYDKVADQNNGVPVKARAQWDREYKGDPLTNYLGGQLITRSKYIEAFLRSNPTAKEADAIADWRQLEREYQNRGGRK